MQVIKQSGTPIFKPWEIVWPNENPQVKKKSRQPKRPVEVCECFLRAGKWTEFSHLKSSDARIAI